MEILISIVVMFIVVLMALAPSRKKTDIEQSNDVLNEIKKAKRSIE